MLFGMSNTSSWVFLVGFVICLVTIGFALFAPRLKRVQRDARLRLRDLLLAFVVFHALWLWITPALCLLAWMFWIGDNDHWFYHWNGLIGAAISVAFTGLVVLRIATRRCGPYYFRTVLGASLVLLLMYGGIESYEWMSQIEGSTPRAAAENIMQDMFPSAADERLELVEIGRWGGEAAGESSGITYRIVGPDEPQGQISVTRYSRYWWTIAGSIRYPPFQEQLARAKRDLETAARREIGIEQLREIVEWYPGTDAALEARALLEAVGEEGRPPPGGTADRRSAR